MIQFAKATRKALKGRIAIDGPSGSGKTFTALRMAFSIVAPGKRVVVISSESGAVEKYVGLAPDGTIWDFDIGYLPDFSPDTYTKSILAAGKAGYDVIVIDSLSHAWAGEGGALELVDRAASKSQSQNTYFAWRDITPMHNRMLEAIVRSPAHIIGTMRSKTEYVIENVGGKSVPKKVGMSPIQRAGMEYEFDLYCSMNLDHVCFVSKTRCPALDGMMQVKPGAEFIEPFGKWLAEGVSVPDGYYSADESDMKKLEKAEEDSKTPEEKAAEAEAAKKAAIEKQRAALKKTATTPAPTPEPSPSPASPSEATTPADTKPAVVLITDAVKASVTKLYSEATKAGKFAAADLTAYLGKCGAAKLSELSDEQGLQLKGLLMKATQPAEVGNAATEANAISNAKAVTIVIREPVITGDVDQSPHDKESSLYTDPGTITKSQHARIAELTKTLPPSLWPNDKRKEFLAGYKVASFNSLSNYVAGMLINELEKLAGEKGLTGTANVPAATPAA
jgi:hypothetical protein